MGRTSEVIVQVSFYMKQYVMLRLHRTPHVSRNPETILKHCLFGDSQNYFGALSETVFNVLRL